VYRIRAPFSFGWAGPWLARCGVSPSAPARRPAIVENEDMPAERPLVCPENSVLTESWPAAPTQGSTGCKEKRFGWVFSRHDSDNQTHAPTEAIFR